MAYGASREAVGEADLMLLLGPADLGAEPVGDPDVRATITEELFDHRLAAAGANHEGRAVGVMEDPTPPGALADPHAGLVRLQDGAGEQAGVDQARGLARKRSG